MEEFNELMDYLFRETAWYHSSPKYWWWSIKQMFLISINRPLCWFGKHRIYDGIFHTIALDSGKLDVFECYHCRYCKKPMNEEKCQRKLGREELLKAQQALSSRLEGINA